MTEGCACLADVQGVLSRPWPPSMSHLNAWKALLASSEMPSYSWSSFTRNDSVMPPTWSLLESSAVGVTTLQSHPLALLDVRCPVMVLPLLGVVISSKPKALLDLAGGCCRTGHLSRVPLAYRHLGAKGGPGNPLRLLQQTEQNSSIEYKWLFVISHSHSQSYFHAVGESAPKVMWGLRMLHAHPEIKVLSDTPIARQMLGLLGLSAARNVEGYPAYARRVTMPQLAPSWLFARLMQSMRAEIRRRHPPRTPAGWSPGFSSSVMVVRRSILAGRGGRAMINHDELMVRARVPGQYSIARHSRHVPRACTTRTHPFTRPFTPRTPPRTPPRILLPPDLALCLLCAPVSPLPSPLRGIQEG